jgi:murein DD-endopeptidase MepM/ murein hydrolase activator NlpD
MMSNIIEEQHIRRRKKPSLLHRAVNQKPLDYQGGFFSQLKQKPARTKRRGSAKTGSFPFRQAVARPDRKNRPFSRQQRKERETGFRQEPGNRQERKSQGFSFPVPSFATLAVIAGTLVVSLLALNWDGISLPLNRTYALEPGPDTEAERNLASYAGIPSLEAAVHEGEEIPLELMETFNWTSYQVKRGDSVSKIAVSHGISMDAIIASNNISNARRLREGETLKIPNMDGIPYTVKKGDSLSKISKSMGVPLEAILDANDIRSDTISLGASLFIPGAKMKTEELKLALGELFIYPIRGRLTSPYGWRNDPISGVRRYHAALDMASPIGTPVKAAMDGKVSALGYNATYGRFIILSHDGGYQSMYAHLSASSVKQGDYVNQGSKIGEVGNTGYSTGPHLHFAIYKNGRALNPLDLLN